MSTADQGPLSPLRRRSDAVELGSDLGSSTCWGCTAALTAEIPISP